MSYFEFSWFSLSFSDLYAYIGQAGVRQLWSSGGSGLSAEEERGAQRQRAAAAMWKDQFCGDGNCCFHVPCVVLHQFPGLRGNSSQRLFSDFLFSCLCRFLQVDNAATKGASAVLIYPDAQDYKYLASTPLFGHVGFHTHIRI